MGFVLSTISVFLRDMFYIYGIIITIWTYLTPIFYPISILPAKVKMLILLNPLYVYIDNFREIILYGRIPSLSSNLLCITYAFLALLIGTLAFRRTKDKFIFYI